MIIQILWNKKAISKSLLMAFNFYLVGVFVSYESELNTNITSEQRGRDRQLLERLLLFEFLIIQFQIVVLSYPECLVGYR